VRRWRYVVRLLSQYKPTLLPADPAPELVAQLAQETYNTDLLHLLVQNIARFEFESRKDVVQIFNNLLRRQIGSRWPTVEYLSSKHEVIFSALAGYENEEVALNTGMILKEILRHEQLAKIFLHSDQWVLRFLHACVGLRGAGKCRFYNFPHYIETTTFGISCDAFANLKETLTRHKPMVAEYLDKNYDRVSDRPKSHNRLIRLRKFTILLLVFLIIHYPNPFHQLRYETPVTETSRRDST
jgi:calcium binding protein 39